jgi:hypothetical protein
MRWLAYLAVLLLAGCASPTITLNQSNLSNSDGKDTVELDCTSGKGRLEHSVVATGGKLKVRVDGPAEEKLVEHDLGGTASGSQDITGAKGTWRLRVDRDDFSGTYSVTLTC